MKRFVPLKNRALVTLHDLVAILVAWLGAFWLRFNLARIPPEFLHQALLMVPVVLVGQGIMLWYFGLYRGVWRFASLPDLVRILKASAAGVAITSVMIFVLTRLVFIPRSFSLSPGPGAHYGHRGDPATSEVVCSRTRDGPDRGAETKGCPLTGATDPAFVAAPAAASDREPP